MIPELTHVVHLQHAVRFIPLKLVLNIYSCLSLHGKADQTQNQKPCGIYVFSPG